MLVCKALVDKELVGKALVGKALVGKALVGKALVGKGLWKALVGKALGKGLVGKGLVGKELGKGLVGKGLRKALGKLLEWTRRSDTKRLVFVSSALSMLTTQIFRFAFFYISVYYFVKNKPSHSPCVGELSVCCIVFVERVLVFLI